MADHDETKTTNPKETGTERNTVDRRADIARTRSAVDRLERSQSLSLQSWRKPHGPKEKRIKRRYVQKCGWGRLIFGQTFEGVKDIAATLQDEKASERDIAFYIRDPHVVISLAPQELFLDPSHTYRLWLSNYRHTQSKALGYEVRRIQSRDDVRAMNRVFARRQMMTVDDQFVWKNRHSRKLTYLVAEDQVTGEIIGAVMGVDHVYAFNDPEEGSSLWSLCVDPQTQLPGVGEQLTRRLAEHFLARGRAYMDLSVMHDNREAIALYEKLGFQRVPVFCIKRKNPINEPLFIAPSLEDALNPYAKIIVREARRRGLHVEVIDEEAGYFTLSSGGRSVTCRESLSELTTAVAMSRCENKRVTSRLLHKQGIRVPAQRRASQKKENEAFLKKYNSLVVKPSKGEQGRGVSVDIRSPESLEKALQAAKKVSSEVLLEEYVEGEDLRVIVIDDEMVAAAVRRPPQVTGTGRHTIQNLIEKQSRRRSAATGGESRIPVDQETKRTLFQKGLSLNDVLPAGETVYVRKTANLHSGGTIHDVTDEIHPKIKEVAVEAAHVLQIPVVGLDLIVPRVAGEEYWIVEANERPGLANHEPQPAPERFLDLLFPETAQTLRSVES